ncbi:MAG: hypothetical protein ABSA85_16115 [Terracidiphilus sp.]|jgi:hypothetical protein
MNWRRGILLAGIHLAAAVPLIVMTEARFEAFVREVQADQVDHAPPAWIASDPLLKNAPPGGEEQVVEFSPCDLWVEYHGGLELAWSVNLPATALSGWGQDCPSRWTLAGRLNDGYPWSASTIPSRREVCWGFGLLIAAQWFLVGGFPLIQPKRWWAEPGAFITCCAVTGFGPALIHPIEGLARLPALLAAFAWFWWFVLLLWTVTRLGWRRMTRRRPSAS